MNSIRLKSIYAALVSAFAAIAMVCLAVIFTLFPSFEAIEKDIGNKNAKRAQQAVEQNLLSLNEKNLDWANWIDSYRFIHGDMPDYIDRNVDADTLPSLNIDAILFFDPSYSLHYDTHLSEDQQLRDALNQHLTRVASRLVTAAANDKTLIGLTHIPLSEPSVTALISVNPKSSGIDNAKPAGFLIFVKYQDSQFQTDLQALTQHPINIGKLAADDIQS